MTETAAKAIQNRDQRAVLIRYARGEDIAQIVADGAKHDFVAGTISTLAGFDRSRAKELVRAFDARTSAVAASKPAAKSATAEAPRKATTQPPADREDRARVLTAVADVCDNHATNARAELTELNGDPPAPAVAADPLGDVIARGKASFDQRARHLARRAADSLEALRGRLAEVAAEQERLDAEAGARAEAEAKVAAARAELEAALAEAARYGKAKRQSPKAKPLQDGPPPRDIRAWAIAGGLDCPAFGRIPNHVMDAWRTAHEPSTAPSTTVDNRSVA
jgi:hypothetical protein